MLIACVAAVLTVVTWLDVREARQETFRAMEARGVVLAASVAEIIADPLYRGDVDRIRDMADVARQQGGLKMLQVVAADGRLLVEPTDTGPAVGSVDEEFVIVSLRDRSRTIVREGNSLHVVEPVLAGSQLLGAVHLTYGNASLSRIISELTTRTILTGTGLALVSFAAALIVARVITAPVRNLNSTAQTLASGRLDARVKPQGPKEFRELGQTFNEMASQLQESHIELTEASKAKTRFFSSVTHELKSPLTAIASFTNMLAKDPDGNLDEKQAQFVEVIRRNNAQMQVLISELLDAGRLETGTMGLVMETIDLSETIGEVVETMLPFAASRQQQIVYTASNSPLNIRADRTRMNQVITNLVSNALKYSDDGAKVEIRTHATDTTAYVTVEDTGSGIDPDDLKKLFLPFHRSPRVASSGVEGTGLGLYITNQLVKLQGGHISVKSDLGVGSVFSVGLPVTD